MKYVVELSLLIMLAAPVWLIVYRGYRENWAQFFGLGGMSLAAAFLLDDAYAATTVPVEMAVLSVSVALMLVGTVYKVMQYNRPPPPPDAVERRT